MCALSVVGSSVENGELSLIDAVRIERRCTPGRSMMIWSRQGRLFAPVPVHAGVSWPCRCCAGTDEVPQRALCCRRTARQWPGNVRSCVSLGHRISAEPRWCFACDDGTVTHK